MFIAIFLFNIVFNIFIMILGISSFTYGWSVGVEGKMPSKPMNEVGLVDQAIQFDVNCLQIGDNLPLHLVSKSRLEFLKAKAIKNEIRLEVGARMLTPGHLAHYIEIATFLKAPVLRFVIDSEGYEPSESTIIKIIRYALPLLKRSKIILGIENHDRLKACSLADIIESIGDEHVGICLDCVNSMGSGEGFDTVLNSLAPYTVNVHIKDFKIQRLAHKMGFIITGAETGTGMTDIPNLLDKVSRFGRCESAILEQWVEPEKEIEDTIRKERLWAKRGIQYLKRVPQLKTNKISNYEKQ